MTDRPLIIKSQDPLEEAKKAFYSGGVIAFPTETFYGLSVDPFNPKAIERLFSLKGRAEANPVSVIIADKGMLSRVAIDPPAIAFKLIDRFWPGPLTIVLKAHPDVPPPLIANTGKIGVRVPGSAIARKLSEFLSSPITATSANPSGKRPPVEANEVLAYFNGKIDVLIDGGSLQGRLGSTVVDLTGGKVRIIREGEIPSEEVYLALNK
ncbi:MAG: threonylcarbamoyl-AMP synthase [Deltaproteobacteria bacterium]|nr:threonylcarbamoyl-AMP synthase [Deltaproteobacteria bacterium]